MRAGGLDCAAQGVGQRDRGDAARNLARLVLGQGCAIGQADEGNVIDGRQFGAQTLPRGRVFRQQQFPRNEGGDMLAVADNRGHGVSP